MRLLLIDDNADDRALVERIVKGSGHRVTSVASGLDAMAILERERFDVALVDMRMEDLSGADTIRELKKRDRDMRLLVVSGFDDRNHVMAALEAGADGYLVKTDVPDQLVKALQEVRAGKSPLSSQVGSVVLKRLAEASDRLYLGRIQKPKS